MRIEELESEIKKLDSKVVLAIIASITAIIASIGTIVIAICNYSVQRKNYKLSKDNSIAIQTQKKIDEIRRQLEEFYYPFQSLLSESERLYSLFRYGQPKDFRTLTYLIDNNYQFDNANGGVSPVHLNKNQFKILDSIMEITQQCSNLINSKGSLVTDSSLRKPYIPDRNITDVLFNYDPNEPYPSPANPNLLSLFNTHHHLLKLAQKRSLEKGHIDALKNYVYPRELNKKIDYNILNLEGELNELEKKLTMTK